MAVCVCSSVYIVVFLLFYININVGRCGKQASFFISFVDSSELKKFLWLGYFFDVVVVVYAALTSWIFACMKYKRRKIEK